MVVHIPFSAARPPEEGEKQAMASGENVKRRCRSGSPSSAESSGSSSIAPPPPPPPPPESCGSGGVDGGGGGRLSFAQFMLRNHSNFERSGVPVRFMYFNREGSWVDFSGQVLDSVKSAFLGRKNAVEVSIGGSAFVLDFVHMLQVHWESGKQKSIAWIDEKGACFFPRAFLGEDFEVPGKSGAPNPNIKIEVVVDGKRKQKEGGEPEVTSTVKQEGEDGKRRRLDLVVGENPRWRGVRVVGEGERDYSWVREYFTNRMRFLDPTARITVIHEREREGHLDKAREEAFLKQIEATRAARGDAKVLYAWYGAPPAAVESILKHGFGMPRNSSELPSYGVGVYLSPLGYPYSSSKLAPADDNGEKHLILCKVIVGNLEKVGAGSQQCYPSSVDFDTGTDDPKNPSWFVVWPSKMNTHINPMCVVSFKCTNNIPGHQGDRSVRFTIDKLLTEVSRKLPLAKVEEMVNLWKELKEGKFSKTDFIRQIRGIAGDKVLLSAMQGFRGST